MLFASDDSFSSSLALIEELSLFNLLRSKGVELFERIDNKINRGTWSSNSNHFHEKVVARSKEFAALSPGERLLKTVGELQKLLGIAPHDLHTSYDLTEVSDDICMAAVKILREDREAKFNGNDVGAMIEFQMTKIFGGLDIRMEELSSAQQQNLIDRVREFVSSLPADQQRFIMDKLGAADLSESAIRQAITSGTMWTAFAAAVQVFGFAFYTTAAHLLAIISLHLLPFGAYIGLSSTIAVLSSPWMLPIFAGFGLWYYNRKNDGLRISMAPLMVTSLCLSGMEVQARTPARRDAVIEEALSLWKAARTVRDQKRFVVGTRSSLRDQSKNRLATTRNELIQARARKLQSIGDRNNLDQKLAQVIISATGAIANGRWGASLTALAAEINEIEMQINSARERRDKRSGFWGTISGHAEYLVAALNLNGELSSANDALVQQVKSFWPREGSMYSPDAVSILRAMDEKTSEILDAETDTNRLASREGEESQKFDQALSEWAAAATAQTVAEQRYHGLGAV